MIWRFFLIVNFLMLGCSSEVKTPRQTSNSGIEANEDTRRKPTGGDGTALSIRGFEWGPYAASDAGMSRGIAWETGYFGMRQRKGEDETDLFDYRWYSSTVASGSNLLDSLSGAGCSPLRDLSDQVAGDYVDGVTHSGAFTEEVEENRGIYRLGAKGESDFTYTALDDISAEIVTYDGVIEVDSPTLPSTSQVSLTGATAMGLNVGAVMSILNNNLAGRTTDLTIGDKGDGESYDVVVVVFYPGKAADAGPIKCVLGPGESLDVPASEYQSWLPLKGFVAFSAQTTLADGIWASRLRGEGVEDMEIP